MGKLILGTAIISLTCISLMASGLESYKKCAGCHGGKGEKHALGKSVKIADMKEKDLVNSIMMYRDGALNRYGMGMIMKSQVAELDDDEIEKLAHYIAKMKDEK